METVSKLKNEILVASENEAPLVLRLLSSITERKSIRFRSLSKFGC